MNNYYQAAPKDKVLLSDEPKGEVMIAEGAHDNVPTPKMKDKRKNFIGLRLIGDYEITNLREGSMKPEELEARLKTVESGLRVLQDIEDIKKLQRAYGYFLEHAMCNELADLWTDDGELHWLGYGMFKGKETIRKTWETLRLGMPPQAIHMAMQVSPYITISPDGKTAYGRWNCILGVGSKVGAQGLYENEYANEDNEDGVWKIRVIQYGAFPPNAAPIPDFKDPAEEERYLQEHMGIYPYTKRWSRNTTSEWGPYIRPFHFKHPVTGKSVNETVTAWNNAHPAPLPPGGENWMVKK